MTAASRGEGLTERSLGLSRFLQADTFMANALGSRLPELRESREKKFGWGLLSGHRLTQAGASLCVSRGVSRRAPVRRACRTRENSTAQPCARRAGGAVSASDAP